MSDSNQQGNRAHWRESLGQRADMLWEAFPDIAAPKLPRELERGRTVVWKLATAASFAAFLFSLGIAMHSNSEVDDLTVRLALSEIQSQELSDQLRAANVLYDRSGKLNASSLDRLSELMARAEDPNVQLGILEILVKSGYVKSQADLQFPGNVSATRVAFIRSSFSALYEKERQRGSF